MTGWEVVAAPEPVEGSAPRAGRLEPGLRWLAACQGAWPPRRPSSAVTVRLEPGSLEGGRAQADDVVDRGADLIVVQGERASQEGLLIVAALLDLEPVKAVGTAPGSDWARLTVAVRDGLRTARTHRADPVALLTAVEAGTVAQGAGLLAQAATRRTPVLLDGSVLVAAAGLCASRLAPGSTTWWLAGCAPPAPAGVEAQRELRLPVLLELGLDGPEGADLALLVLEQGCELAARG